MFGVELGKHITVGVGLMTKLDQERRKKSAQALLLIFPKIAVEERQ
jgi:hypothetical protein